MIDILSPFLVAAGGFAGAMTRFAVGRYAAKRFGAHFPYGTLFINVTGSFCLGYLAGMGLGADAAIWLLCGTGFMGAYTTFSTFKTESVALLRRNRFAAFGLYLAASYSVGITLAYVGYAAAKSL